MLIRNSKEQNGRSNYAGHAGLQPHGQHAGPRARPSPTRCSATSARYSEAAARPARLLPLLPDRGLRHGRLAGRRATSASRSACATRWHQPIYTEGNNMTSFDPAPLRPGAGGGREQQRHAGARQRRPLQRAWSARATACRRRRLYSVPERRAARRVLNACPTGAPRGFYANRSSVFVPALQLRLDARRATARPPSAAASASSTTARRATCYFGGGGNGPVNSPPYALSSQYENGNLAAPAAGPCPRSRPGARSTRIDPGLQVPRQWSWSAERAARAGLGPLRRDRLRRRRRART